MAVEPQHAYALDLDPAVEDSPPTGTTPANGSRIDRIRWALSLAALLAAAAAFVVAGAHGARVITAPAPAPVTVTLPPPAINNAYGVGIALGTNGKTERDAVDWIRQAGVPAPELFVKLAQKHYCPQGHLCRGRPMSSV